MKRYLKGFKFTLSFVRNRIYKCLDTKRWTRKDTSYFLARYYIKQNNSSLNLHEVARELRKLAFYNRDELFPLVDYISEEIFKEITTRNIDLPPIEYQIRKDASNGKEREIGISSIKQQCYDYIAVGVCEEMFLKKIGKYQCASLKNKGQVFGKCAIERWIRQDFKNCKYVYKCDIKKYYPSVEHDMIKRLLARDIKNDLILYLLDTLIDSYKEGLCIGSYLCQYLANYMLSYLYHFLEGKASHFLFYMDDIILFSGNKKKLKRTIKEMKEYLSTFHLSIKSNEVLFRLDSRYIDMMGYRIRTSNTIVRKRIFKRASRIYRKARYSFKSLKRAYRTVSYFGYFVHSNSFMYLTKHRVFKTMTNAKKKISYEMRIKYA